MNASHISTLLQQHGVAVQAVEHGASHVDGRVQISELVHVTVPTTGNALWVVAQSADGTNWDWYPEHQLDDVPSLIADIRAACAR